MKWIFQLGLIVGIAIGMEFKGKVEPFQQWIIKSDVVGKVVRVRLEQEGKIGDEQPIVKLDDGDERIKLKSLSVRIKLLQKKIALQKQVVKKKLNLYNRIKNLQTKSLIEKEQRYFDYSGTLLNLLNLEESLTQAESEIALLKRTITKKRIGAKGLYVVKIYPKVGDFIGVGAPVLEVADLTREKIVLFVPVSQIIQIKKGKVYIDGKPSNFKIYKIWRVTDSKYITSYRVELVGEGLVIGKIYSISFK